MSLLAEAFRKGLSKVFAFLVATIGKGFLKASLFTCQWQVEGLSHFIETASKKKVILMLWHNRLSITSFILSRSGSQFQYVAFVSNSRDGELIHALVNSYRKGKTIKVPHQSRHEALRLLIRTIQNSSDVAVITPDGPRGPKYEVKPGIAFATLATKAEVVPMSWQASRYWQLKSWDRLKIPKPFSTIKVTFFTPLSFVGKPPLQEVQQKLQAALPCD